MQRKDMFEKSNAFDMSRFSIEKTKSSERNELLRPFVEKINNSRIANGYKPYTAAYIASRMSYIQTDELYYFYKKLSEAKNFGALWHWYVNPKRK